MRKAIFSIMLFSLTIATMFTTSCTKSNSYGVSGSRFTSGETDVTITAPTDQMFPLSGEVRLTITNNDGSTTYVDLDREFPPTQTDATTTYVGKVMTSASTSMIRVEYCSVNQRIHKVITGSYELAHTIKL